jgi:hypothetical protein
MVLNYGVGIIKVLKFLNCKRSFEDIVVSINIHHVHKYLKIIVGSCTPHGMFLVVFERGAAGSRYGMKSGTFCTGRRLGRFVLVAVT